MSRFQGYKIQPPMLWEDVYHKIPKKHKRFSKLYGHEMVVLEDPVQVEDGWTYPVKITRYPVLPLKKKRTWKTKKI